MTESYDNLVEAAQHEHDHGHHEEAIILAQTAVEIFTEKVLRHLYAQRKIEYLKGAFEHLLINYNIGNAKVSELYIALSEDDIKQAPFWSAYIAHTELRNDLIHEGKDATAGQSEASLAAVRALIAHIVSVNGIL
jgi:hypothetical protein